MSQNNLPKSGDREAETKDIVKAVESITPTAQMMSEKIEEIRKWARKNIKRACSPAINDSALAASHQRTIEL